ncbi:hypothetical protein L3V82_06440 [Thiotrichales bacterium 19S3-7]|nr:hypothetical protein [Thiotrichales bacterium 19S3-7]MCF6801735.1 hypothetical protein [Thiotrichales bacterium 19S3-11]
MKKVIRRVTYALLGIFVILTLLVFILGCLFTWRMSHYDSELSSYLSEKLNSKIQLDLTDVSWQGINPVLTFKTIKINQKSADISSQLQGLSVKISLLKSILSWQLAPENIQLNDLKVNVYLNRQSQLEVYNLTSKDVTKDWQAIQKTTQSTLSQLLKYIDGIQPEVIIKALKLNLFGKDNKQIALMGSISIRHVNNKGYYFKGHIDSALKQSHFGFDFEIGRSQNQAYLEGYFDVMTKDLQKAVNFLGLDMLKVSGKRLKANGYVNFQPANISHIAIRINGDDLILENINRQSKLRLDHIVMDVGGQYHPNGQFKVQVVPHELVINQNKRLFKQLEIEYLVDNKLPWQMNLYYAQLKLLTDIRNVIPKNMILKEMQPYIESGTIKGEVTQLQIQRADLHNLDSPFIVDANFLDISYLNPKFKLNLSGISGNAHISNEQGRLAIQAKSLNIDQSIIGMHNFPETTAKASLQWTLNHKKLDLSINSLRLGGTWFNVTASGDVLWDFKNALPFVDITAAANAKDVTQAQVRGFLPKTHMTPKLHEWLYENIYGAKAVNANLKLRGNLSDFPYVDGKGIFKLTANASGARLTPWEGWPLITDAKGMLDFDQGRFEVSASRGQTLGVELLPSNLTVNDIRPHIVSEMTINIHTKTNSVDAKNYVLQSPLEENARQWLDWMQYHGDIASDVKISVPLGNKKPMHVVGVLKLEKGQFGLKVFPSIIDIYNASGVIKFNDDYATELSVRGWLGLNAPFAIDYTQAPKGKFNVITKATITDSMSLPAVIRSKLHGQSEVNLTANWQDSGGEIEFNSLFNGLSFELPEPFVKKQRKSYLPTHIKFSWHNDDDLIRSFDLQANLNKQFNLSAQFDLTTKLIKLIGNANSLDVSGWINLVQLLSSTQSAQNKFGYDNLIHPKNSEIQNAQIASILLQPPFTLNQRLNNLLNNFKPQINFNIKKLAAFQQLFDDVRLFSSAKKSSWLLTLASNKADHKLDVELTVPFSQNYWQLTINELRLTSVGDLDYMPQSLNNFSDFPWWLPSIDIVINRLNYQKIDLLNQSNLILNHQVNTIDVPYYLLKGDNIFLLGTASWNGATDQTKLDGSATSNNWGAFFKSLGLDDILVDGEGPVVFDVSYNGGLYPDIDTLNGKLMFGINKGQFPKLKPGLSKLLGIFSLEAMLDRLGSGVNDLGKEGLYFNRIYGKYLIEDGVMKTTQDILVDTPSFDMQISGEINFVQQSIDQTVIIQPHFSGTMAVAASLIGGPIAGLATYVADKLAGASIFKNQGMAKITVKGPWDKPLINGK